jgi:hypothetical protein
MNEFIIHFAFAIFLPSFLISEKDDFYLSLLRLKKPSGFIMSAYLQINQTKINVLNINVLQINGSLHQQKFVEV